MGEPGVSMSAGQRSRSGRHSQDFNLTRNSRLLLTIVKLVAYFGWEQFYDTARPSGSDVVSVNTPTGADDDWHSGQHVRCSGRVIRLLPDDNAGSRHQRFIIELPGGRTLLVAHNIDLAPRVANLQKGDMISFNGEFEWNDRGGVIHWTHHDPSGDHEAGWIRHNGRDYQ